MYLFRSKIKDIEVNDVINLQLFKSLFFFTQFRFGIFMDIKIMGSLRNKFFTDSFDGLRTSRSVLSILRRF